MNQLEEIKRKIEELPEVEKDRLIDWMMGGDSDVDEKAIEEAWLDEAERRSAEFHAGKVKAIPSSEIHAEIKAKYGFGD